MMQTVLAAGKVGYCLLALKELNRAFFGSVRNAIRFGISKRSQLSLISPQSSSLKTLPKRKALIRFGEE